MPTFSRDWISGHARHWLEALGPFVGKEHLRALEIGCFEGRSTLWFLQNVLTHPTSAILCVDPRHNPRFDDNIADFRHKIRVIRKPSQIALRDCAFSPETFSFAYVDGSHLAADVLEDAVLVFRLLRPGGVVIFDDYAWNPAPSRPPLSKPQMGIDAFMQIFHGQYQLLHKEYQVVLAKNQASASAARGSDEISAAIDYLQRGTAWPGANASGTAGP